MSLRIAGMGWVTPLGSNVDSVWHCLLNGDAAIATKIVDEPGSKSYSVYRVPESGLASVARQPRLRRASAISRFAAAAGLEALKDAGVRIDSDNAKRVALIFAISNGGVIYTKRFYRDIVESGAQAASPLLFPETVFNAPASHLAAILGITGATYTLVGDGAVGILALRMAEDLMSNDEFDCCLVVGAEEVDWLLCDAYRKWRLLRLEPPIEPFAKTDKGMILSEGAGAVVVGREGFVKIEMTASGGHYHKRTEAGTALDAILSSLTGSKIDIVIASANGTFVDNIEYHAISRATPDAVVYTAKPALGEAPGATGLWQTIVACKALVDSKLPPMLHVPSAAPLNTFGQVASVGQMRRAIVLSTGLNQQVAGLRLALP